MDTVQNDLIGGDKSPFSGGCVIGPKTATSRITLEHDTRCAATSRLATGKENPDLMLRLPDVVLWLGVSRATLYRWIAAGDFPAPTKLSARTSAWPRRAVAAWLAQREAQAA